MTIFLNSTLVDFLLQIFAKCPTHKTKQDHQAKRIGVLTTEATKHAMCGLVNSMLREHRIHIAKNLVSRDPAGIRVRLREQLEVSCFCPLASTLLAHWRLPP